MTRELIFNDHTRLEDADPELYNLIKLEEERIRGSIDLIASENYPSAAVLDCLGSCMTFKYSEGTVGKRYYGGCEVIDKVEQLCKDRALNAFGLDPNVWGVNVQPLSGSPANLAVYLGLLQPHDKIMGLELASGGHLTHGYYAGSKNVSASSTFYSSLPYGIDKKTGLIDHEDLDRLAKSFHPRLIIAGASCYARETCDAIGAYLMADIAHISGLIAAGVHPSPFEYCDVVTTTTHKTLKGPRAGLIFYNKQRNEGIQAKIDSGVFPALQGGPHNNAIAAIATQLKQVSSPEWKIYANLVVNCAKRLAAELSTLGFDIITGGTDNHTVIVSLKPFAVTGAKAQMLCDAVNISLTKTAVPGDAFPNTSGVRLGTPALVSRGCNEEDMVAIAAFIHETVQLAKTISKKYGKLLKDFARGVDQEEAVKKMKAKVEAWARELPVPGI